LKLAAGDTGLLIEEPIALRNRSPGYAFEGVRELSGLTSALG
jgi:hypothetical protein